MSRQPTKEGDIRVNPKGLLCQRLRNLPDDELWVMYNLAKSALSMQTLKYEQWLQDAKHEVMVIRQAIALEEPSEENGEE